VLIFKSLLHSVNPYYIVLILNKLEHLYENIKRVIERIKRLMKTLTQLVAFKKLLHENILTNCLYNKIQKQYIYRLDYKFNFLSLLTMEEFIFLFTIVV